MNIKFTTNICYLLIGTIISIIGGSIIGFYGHWQGLLGEILLSIGYLVAWTGYLFNRS